MPLQRSLFFLKSAPGVFLSSAVKWALRLTRTIELLSLTVCTLVQTRWVVAAWANVEALSSRADQGRSGTMPDRGRPVHDHKDVGGRAMPGAIAEDVL
jgi:hypothetical protein